jgi:hypothetical protein
MLRSNSYFVPAFWQSGQTGERPLYIVFPYSALRPNPSRARHSVIARPAIDKYDWATVEA